MSRVPRLPVALGGGVHPDPGRRPYLGYRDGDADTDFGHFFRAELAPLADHVVAALSTGAVAAPLIRRAGDAGALLDDGYEHVETGYVLGGDGSMTVAARTPMPGVTAEMWDWWFGWHGCDPRRYKLWHPRAHLWAAWDDGRGPGEDAGRRGRERYVGRTSYVDEYLGSVLMRASIRFVPPSELGIDEAPLADGEQTVICARVGSSDAPVDIGWLAHQVRPVDGGAEMRSRFWFGGPHIVARTDIPGVRQALPVAARRLVDTSDRAARELLVHCAQEMAHLASFLPELHAELGHT